MKVYFLARNNNTEFEAHYKDTSIFTESSSYVFKDDDLNRIVTWLKERFSSISFDERWQNEKRIVFNLDEPDGAFLFLLIYEGIEI